jgi:ABC-type branched-subunit amino acid transport system ATPase component
VSDRRSPPAALPRVSARWSSPATSRSRCRKGVRYALIGPNGAGKTTLINLITGMLRPDAGRIFLDDADITALPPEQRVRRGLVRTYQINSLFPHLTALESVTLAVCERSRVRAHLVAAARRLPARDRRGL